MKLKLKWTNDCVLVANGNDNTDADPNNINSTVKDTKLYLPFFPLSPKDNQKLSKCLSKGFQRSVYWNKSKTKNDNKNTANECRCFLGSNYQGDNRLFILIYSNRNDNAGRYKARQHYLPKGIMKHYNVVIINEKNVYDQLIDSNIK